MRLLMPALLCDPGTSLPFLPWASFSVCQLSLLMLAAWGPRVTRAESRVHLRWDGWETATQHAASL